MKNNLLKTSFFLYLLATLLYAANSSAHHSFGAEFDADALGELTGVVTQIRFSNPHVRYRVDVTSTDGSVESWELQAASVTSLRGQNWVRDSVKVGDVVSVAGQLGRNGAKKLFIRGIQTNDGRSFGRVAGSAINAGTQEDTVIANAQGGYGFGEVSSKYPADITGYWNNGYKFRVTVDDLEPKPVSFTPQGRALYESVGKYDDPALRCLAYGLPRLFGNPYNMTIYDAGSHYLFLYVDHNSPRRIWMDGRAPDANMPSTSNGFSVGRWQGDELFIETTHLTSGWLDGSGYPMSGEGTRIEERYTVSDDQLTIDRVMTIHDPYYTTPLTRVRGSARRNNLDVYEQSACDPTGYFSDLNDAGMLEKYLDPDEYLNP